MNRPIDPALLDRLVDGELDQESRRELLLRIDSTPGGWKGCALAFLEAQEFGQAARAWARDHAGPSAKVPSPRPVHAPMPRLAMAATIAAVAFFGGFSARGWAEPAGGEQPERLVVDTRPAEAPRPDAQFEAGPTPPDPAPAEESPPPMPDYVRAQWARLGYKVERTHKLISMEEDGRRETLPVEGYRVEYVGRPTY